MRDFFEEGRDSTIVIDERYLLPSYLPEDVLFREREMGAIADAIKPFLRGKGGRHVFVYGRAGVGKTTAIKHLAMQASRVMRSLCVYANCWETYTAMGVLNKIVEKMRLPLPRRGLAVDEIFRRICSFVEHYDKRVVVFLDDVDGLKQHELLGLLLKANEGGMRFLLAAVSQSREWIASLEPRLYSMFSPTEVYFRPYSEKELYEIVAKRAQLALKKGSYSERLLLKIAKHSSSARDAIERLRSAARRAEELGKEVIEIQDLEESAPTYCNYYLSDEERFIFELLEKGERSTEEIYREFVKFKQITKRQLRNYLLSLQKKGVVIGEGAKEKRFRLNEMG